MPPAVASIRSFNRAYTRRIGLLEERLTDSPFTLAEARVLYELAQGSADTAADLGRILDMDKAHLSRILSRFEARELVATRPDPAHGRRRLLALTPAGRHAFADLDRAADAQAEAILAPLPAPERERLVAALGDIQSLLAPAEAAPIGLREPRPGDLGWVIHRQAALYHQEYGWDWTYEGLAAEILAGFVADFDPGRDAAWVADRDGQVVGSVFLMKTDDPAIGKLRLLYVEPSARGQGLGARLVGACVDQARAFGYRSLILWTNDVLVSARRIYEHAGFELISVEPHNSFGQELTGQVWRLEL